MKSVLKTLILFVFILCTNTIISQEPTDCTNAVITCGNSNIELNVNGIGTQELGFGLNCSSQENNSLWLKVTPATGGTLGFTLTPNSSNISEDYDFFIFGPNVSCGNLGQAIRCSTTNPESAGQANNLTGMNGTENDTSEGPGPDGNSFVKWLDVNPGDSYFIVIDRPIGNSSFTLEWTGTAKFEEPPTNQSSSSPEALNLEECDNIEPFNDGFATFNINNNTALIRGGQTNVAVTYHTSISDANIGINAISSPYRNVRNPQTIYARITDNSTECFELTDFQLNVNLGPDFTKPTDYILCDNLNDGNDKNGRTFFDLSSKTSQILADQSNANLNISYFTSRTNAENNIDPLPNSYYNSTPFNELVYVRVTDTNNAQCSSITTLNLITNPIPEAFNSTLVQCDEDGLSDGITTFNLNEANAELTGNAANRSTKFYSDSARTAELNPNNYENSLNPQIIYVEVINDLTGCIGFSELTLNVTVTDSNNTSLNICDDDGLEDGLHEFDLNDAEIEILTGLPAGLNIAYYLSLDDALLEQSPLNRIFTNTIPDSQTIYARVENANDCYGISEVTLNVLPLPEIKTNDLFYYCLNNFPETITIDAALISGNPSDYSYNWSTGDTTYSTQINAPGTYSVTVQDRNNINCSQVRVVTIEPSNIASFNTPSINIIDLSENNSITVFVTGEGTYQYSLVDVNNNTIKPYQDSHIFNNVFPGTYSILVKDTKNDCGVVNEQAYVIGFPKFFTPNNDGVNDTWQVYGISAIAENNTKVQIFNRFGKLIKEMSPTGAGWDGLLNGVKLPTDDYWFSIQLHDGRIIKNHFALLN